MTYSSQTKITFYIKIDLTSARALLQLYDYPLRLTRPAIYAAIGTVAHKILATSQAYMAYFPKTGRVYRLPDGRLHRASAVGEAPAILSGKLINSGHVQARSGCSRKSIIQWDVYFNAPYAGELEARYSRPYLSRATKELEEVFYDAIEKAVKTALRA